MRSSGIYSRYRLGEWSSILIPVKDEQGKVIAMFVMDISANEIRDAQLKLLTRLASAFTLLLILSIMIQTLALRRTLAPLKLLLTAVKELGQGNFSIQLKINRKDDLGQLAEGFNSAVTNIKSLISKESPLHIKLPKIHKRLINNRKQTRLPPMNSFKQPFFK